MNKIGRNRKEELVCMQEIYDMVYDFELFETVLFCYIHLSAHERREVYDKLRAKYNCDDNLSPNLKGYISQLMPLMDVYRLICEECEDNPGQQCETTSTFPEIDIAIRKKHGLPDLYSEHGVVEGMSRNIGRVFRSYLGAYLRMNKPVDRSRSSSLDY